MQIQQVVEVLKICLPARLPVMLTGKPGIGKTDIVFQAAEALGYDVLLSHPAISDPTTYQGFPWPDKKAMEATFLPFGQLARALKATKPTVWFLDDFGQASPAVQAACMQLFLARELNGQKIPDCVTFVVATNGRKHRAGVQGILEPVKSRFASIIEVETNLNAWTTWALESGKIRPEIIAFLRFRASPHGDNPGRDLLLDFDPKLDADIENYPCPRTWSHASKLLDAGLPKPLRFEVLKGAVGAGASTELCGFLDIFEDVPNPDAVLVDPDSVDVPQQPSILFALTSALSNRASAATFRRIARYAERMLEAGQGEFATLLIQDALRRDPKIQKAADFTRVVTGPLGEMFNA